MVWGSGRAASTAAEASGPESGAWGPAPGAWTILAARGAGHAGSSADGRAAQGTGRLGRCRSSGAARVGAAAGPTTTVSSTDRVAAVRLRAAPTRIRRTAALPAPDARDP